MGNFTFFQILLKFQMANTGQLLNYFWSQKQKKKEFMAGRLQTFCYIVSHEKNTRNSTLLIFNAYYVSTKLIVLADVVISCGHIASTIWNSFCIFLGTTVGLRNFWDLVRHFGSLFFKRGKYSNTFKYLK